MRAVLASAGDGGQRRSLQGSPLLVGRIASGGCRPAIRAGGGLATVPKESRFSPVLALSVDCGSILPCVAGPCFQRRMTCLGAASRPHRVRRLVVAAGARARGPAPTRAAA